MIHLPDEDATARLAAFLAPRLPEGSVLLLQGPMGAGKTTFVRHLARALGFSGRVTSPTYTLMHAYPTPGGTLLHVDVHRLPDPEALYDLGYEDAAAAARLTVIEWGRSENFPALAALALEPGAAPDERRARWLPLAAEARSIGAALAAAFPSAPAAG